MSNFNVVGISLPLVSMLNTCSSSHNTPTPCKHGRMTSTCPTVVFFFGKIVPRVNILIQAIRVGQRFVGHQSCFLYRTFLTSNVPKATQMCRVKMVLKMVRTWNDCWLLRVMNEYILSSSLITQLVSPQCSFLFTSRHNNQPLDVWNWKLWSNLSRGGLADWDGSTVWDQQNLAQLGFKQGYGKAD